jgi:glycosyltransferase involved in cell wall biosynthesis
MKICFIADARSPIAENWIKYFISREHDVSVISSYPCNGETFSGVSVHVVASKLTGRAQTNHDRQTPGRLSHWTEELRNGRFADLILNLQHRVEQSDVSRRSKIIRSLLERIRPDLVHAMRLPFEGILAVRANSPAPLLISIWGNDLTLFARRFRWTGRESLRALRSVDALHCDCTRDLNLARQMGFDSQKPSIVLPGGGGIQTDFFGGRSRERSKIRHRFNIPEEVPLVCNPRGFRAYVRSDTFFRSAALTVRKRPDAVFAAVGMQGHPIAERWIASLGIQQNVRLLPTLSRSDMAALLQTSDIMVSPSEHDGTPNTLLESMAAGAFPIVGDIESVREWITDGINGSLPPPGDPGRFSEAIVGAIANTELRYSAAAVNRKLIEERADYNLCIKKAEDFYHQLIQEQRNQPGTQKPLAVQS